MILAIFSMVIGILLFGLYLFMNFQQTKIHQQYLNDLQKISKQRFLETPGKEHYGK